MSFRTISIIFLPVEFLFVLFFYNKYLFFLFRKIDSVVSYTYFVFLININIQFIEYQVILSIKEKSYKGVLESKLVIFWLIFKSMFLCNASECQVHTFGNYIMCCINQYIDKSWIIFFLSCQTRHFEPYFRKRSLLKNWRCIQKTNSWRIFKSCSQTHAVVNFPYIGTM